MHSFTYFKHPVSMVVVSVLQPNLLVVMRRAVGGTGCGGAAPPT